MKESLWWDGKGNYFKVIDENNSWVRYKNIKTNQEFNCLVAAFENRFTELTNAKDHRRITRR